MRIPKQLKVGGHWYKIIYPYSFRERTDRMGHCDYAMQEIVISESDNNGVKVPQSKTKETFLHEILHAVDWVYNADSLKEEDIDRMAEGLYQVLSDNKLLNL